MEIEKLTPLISRYIVATDPEKRNLMINTYALPIGISQAGIPLYSSWYYNNLFNLLFYLTLIPDINTTIFINVLDLVEQVRNFHTLGYTFQPFDLARLAFDFRPITENSRVEGFNINVSMRCFYSIDAPKQPKEKMIVDWEIFVDLCGALEIFLSRFSLLPFNLNNLIAVKNLNVSSYNNYELLYNDIKESCRF